MSIEISKHHKHALLFGATGLIGGFLLKHLLENDAYAKVTIFVRKKPAIDHEKLNIVPLDFTQLENEKFKIQKSDDVFICLGTTIKKAGSKQAFRTVDYTYITEVAAHCYDKGANQLLVVSSVGADKNSYFFYSKVKGETEEQIQHLKFWSTHIFRPSLLLGERNENRWGEQIAGVVGKGLNKLMGGTLKKYKPIEAEAVARAMVAAAQRFVPGVHVYESDQLQDLAEAYYENKNLTRR
jgi:uncharacterized protein YbjT (DUF2867 family)